MLGCGHWQGKLAALVSFRKKVCLERGAAGAVTAPQLVQLSAYLSLEDRNAAYEYCFGLSRVIVAGGCDIVLSSGCIPIIVECLRRWPADGPEGIVFYACEALYALVVYGSAAVHTAITRVPGVKATLEAAERSRLEAGYSRAVLNLPGM